MIAEADYRCALNANEVFDKICEQKNIIKREYIARNLIPTLPGFRYYARHVGDHGNNAVALNA